MDDETVKLPDSAGALAPVDASAQPDGDIPAYIPQRMRGRRGRGARAGSHSRPGRWRGVLLGCGVAALIALPLLGAGWWFASRNLGRLVSGLVRTKAAESLNGRLEFANLDIDLAGRAVLTDAAVFMEGMDSAVLTCRRVVVTLDFLNFIGPNRGRRAVVVDLYDAQAQLVREPDGGFNVNSLVKPPEQQREPIGVSVHLHDAVVDFTDACLLEQGFPQLPAAPGLAQTLLDELGYSAAGPGESQVHTETLTVAGAVNFNPERAELALDLRAQRSAPGGALTAKGMSNADGSVFELTLGLADVELSSLSDYARALFPALRLADSTPEAKPGQAVAAPAVLPAPAPPHAAGLIRSGRIVLAKQPGKELAVTGSASLSALTYASRSLPELRFPTLQADYDGERLSGEFKLEALGCAINGNPTLDFEKSELRGTVTLVKTEVAGVLAALRQENLGLDAKARNALKQQLPVQGAISATVALGGSLSAPEFNATLSSDKLSYGKLDLGRLSGNLRLAQGSLYADKVQFSGGAAAAKLTGSLDTRTQTGRFSLSAGPLSVAEAVDLAARIGNAPQPAKVDVQGKFTLTAEAQITAGKLRSTLGLSSDKLVVAGQTLIGVKASGSIAPTELRIKEATATYLSTQPVQLAEFISTGPLRVSLRAGGSLTQLPGGKTAVALTGKASTLNLAPQQANASFKVSGPLNDPLIKLQLKTAGTANPLAISAKGHYRQGWAPLTATLTWFNTTADFNGKVDFAKQLLDGKLTADAVDIGRFVPGQQLSGVLSAQAQIGGSFKQPSISGRVALPVLTYALPKRNYQVKDLAAGFKLVGTDTLSIVDGKFNFEGNVFSAQGVLGKRSKELTLSCPQFNLLSVLALAETTGAGGKGKPLSVRSAGPLTVKIGGDPKDPQAVISYASGAGSVEGHAFDSAKLNATASLDGVNVSSFAITSPQGSVTATGQANFARAGKQQASAAPKPKAAAGIFGLFGGKAAAQAAPAPASGVASFNAQVTVDNFDVAVLTPLAGGTALSSLNGKLDGSVKLSGTGKQYSADGTLKLTSGRFQNVAISEASATFHTTGQGVEISNGRVTAEGTVLTASGTLGKQPGDIRLKAQAPSLETALANPFLPDSVPRLKGPVRLDLELSPGKGAYPVVDITINGTGQPVYIGENKLDSIAAEATWRDDVLTLKECRLGMQGSSFTASGTLGKQLNAAKLKAQGSNVELGLFAPFLPKGLPQLKGQVGLELALSPGKGQYPNIDATVQAGGGGMSVGTVHFDSAKAEFALQGDQLDIRQCDLAVNGSSLSAGGKLALAGAKAKHDLPLDFWLRSKDFNLAAIAPLLPEAVRDGLPVGTATVDLQLAGRESQPLLSGNAQFALTKLPKSLPLEITALTGDVAFVKNEFDIRRIDIASSDQAGLGQAKITGSGRISLKPVGLVSGSIDIALAPQGKYTIVKYYDPQSRGGKPLFEGSLGGVLRISGGKDAQPVVGGQLVINAPGAVSYLRPEAPAAGSAPVKNNMLLKDLEVLVQPGTEFRFAPAGMSARVDLQATLAGKLTLNGAPGNTDKYSPSAIRIKGELTIPKGSLFIYGRTIRLDGEACKLQFDGEPGNVYPYIQGRGAIILPRVLTGNEILAGGPPGGGSTQVSAGQDLKVYFNFDHIKLDPSSGALDDIRLTSEPPLPVETIRNYLLGGVGSVFTGDTDLSQFAESEALSYGSGFISRVIENQFGLEAFRLGGAGSEDNPYYMEMEKQVTPDVSLTYFRNFFSQTGQQEEFGVKYNVFRSQFGSRYQNLDLRLNFQQGTAGGDNREFMFMWTTKF